MLINSRNLLSDGGGKKKKKAKKRSLDAIELTPQMHGPSRLLLPTLMRTLRTELNGAPTLGWRAQYNLNTIRPLIDTMKLHVTDLYNASQDRYVILQNYHQRANQMQNIPSAPQAKGDGDVLSSITADTWVESMSNECKLAMDILLHREKDILAAKAKEELQSAREEYEKKMAAKAPAQSNGDANGTQKAPENDKAAAKRTAKAAKKAASRQKAAKNERANKLDLLGTGTAWFLNLLKAEKLATGSSGSAL